MASPQPPIWESKVAEIMRMSDEEAGDAFKEIRWRMTAGRPVCPRCGCMEHYTCTAERLWKCKGCKHRFSVTSGTVFGSRKLPLRAILGVIAIYKSGEKHYSALQLSQDLDVQYRTAWDLTHKIRKAIRNTKRGQPLNLEIEADRAHNRRQVGASRLHGRRAARRREQKRAGVATASQEPLIPLKLLKRIVLVAGELDGWIEESEDFRAALVMLAPLSIDSRDPAALACFTGVPEPSVREYTRRLIDNGIWLPNGGLAVDWNDPENGRMAFIMDVWVTIGELDRRPAPADGPDGEGDFAYRRAKVSDAR